MRRLILKSFQSPGDVLMLTAAVRDLHLACPQQFQTDVRTAAPPLWLNNPSLTPLQEGASGVETLDMHYPLIHQSNHRPYHFLHGYVQYLEQHLGVRVPVTRFHGDIHLAPEERTFDLAESFGLREDQGYWIVIAGGKFDFTAKWWNPASYQRVVDHFQGKIQFVQCGEKEHWHQPLEGVVNLVGKTSLRDFVRLMYHADGVLCPVTFPMHLAAAVETKTGKPRRRACVVVAGGREPAHWEAYSHHQFVSTVGALPCCAEGGCWKSRCQLVGDGDSKDRRDLCERPVTLSPDLRIPQCMEMISAEDVIRRIEMYFQGGALQYLLHLSTSPTSRPPCQRIVEPAVDSGSSKSAPTATKISVAFHHGLGDCAHFAHLIPMYVKRGFAVEVECTPDKNILFQAAGASTIKAGAARRHGWGYPPGSTFVGHGRFWQGSKIGHNISEAPLPDIGSKEELWDEYCQTRVNVEPILSAKAKATTERWLEKLPKPVLLLHTKGNTGQGRKNLPDKVVSELYKELLDRFDGTIVLLDWDKRVPRLASYRVRHLDDLGPCSTEQMLALMTKADLLVGIDSGPLHAARLTDIPCMGVWMPGHYPTTYTVPRPQQLNVVLADHTRQWNRFKRIPWRIVEHPGGNYEPNLLADYCVRMLQAPRYLKADKCRGERAADVQLQEFIERRCRGTNGNSLCSFADRHRSFDALFQHMAEHFPNPTIVETGTMRAEEDWGGAGFFTYLAGAFLLRHGGVLHSVDINPQNCSFARIWTEVFGRSVQIHQGDSVAFLANCSSQIDLLYLDSLDATEPGHADHAQRELDAALPKLHKNSLILVDDTPWQQGSWFGKGARIVPFLLDHGWHVVYGGYQVLLSRNT